jgi:hypothetical protein
MSRCSRDNAARPIPAWRRRYPNDMAVARQSEPDQSVNAEAAAADELSVPDGSGNIDFMVQSLA